MSEQQSSLGAVFLSYAREDADAARRIADALRAFGLEVWFDQSELRGGDTWDAKIKAQIRTCALFLPIISVQTQRRNEGYFRREWKFGVERTHDMAAGVAFVVPVVIDDTSEANARVPEEFMRFQWTRLPHGVPTPQFIEQVKTILENPESPAPREQTPQRRSPKATTGMVAPSGQGSRYPAWTVGALLAAVVGCAAALYLARKPESQAEALKAPTGAKVAESATAPVSKSIAVLPFANFSPDKDNEFFADGLQDEVITALAKIHDLKVISRTSVLAYKNPEGRNLKKIGNELGVATVLEGSVQRVGNKVHLNVQLIDARTDDHIWADSYTEELTDVFSLESALAEQIAAALNASLTTDEKALIGRRPTQNQEAYDLYLRARVLEERLGASTSTKGDALAVITLFEQAEAKDPLFVSAHVQASILHGSMYWYSAFDPTEARREKDLAELKIVQQLAPSAPETRLAQGEYDYECLNNWAQALSEYRAASLGLPNDAQVHYGIARSLRRLGRFSEALAEFKTSASLNPNDDNSAFTIVEMTFALHRYQEALELGQYYGERFPHEDYLQRFRYEAKFQVDGDRAAMLKGIAALNPYADDPPVVAYRLALLEGNYLEAERALSDAKTTTVSNESGSIADPADLHRAYMAYLLGKKAEAKVFSEAAIAEYHRNVWTQRQRPWAHLGIARAEAYGGLLEDAVRDGKAALGEMAPFDAYDGLQFGYEYGKILVIAGRRDEALSDLAEVTAKPMFVAPRSISFDPIWSRLKADPRFESILDSVKPL